MSDVNDLDWDCAREHIEACESAYASIGSAGYYCLTAVIRPMRDRLNKGERTQELFDDIMGIEL